ncbi:MAG TPA: hypothetical protein VGB48_10320 [Allosphingosinicella sp.]|jgi:hypothetical protein
MNKRLSPLAFSALALLAAACTEAPQRTAALDAEQLDRLTAFVEAEARAANPPKRGALPDQLASADRLSGTIARLEPERLDPNLVVSAIAR